MVLPLPEARLCLDCDCLTDRLLCPRCDREGTVPIVGWFRPLEGSPARSPRPAKTAASPRRWAIVVRHGHHELYRVLRHALVGTGVEILYERRVGERRRIAAGPRPGERRRTDRRRSRASAVLYETAAAADGSGSPSHAKGASARDGGPRPRQTAPV
jgi:hypothetical protein